MKAPKSLNPGERTVTVHIKVPESIHAEFFAECNEMDIRGGALLRRLLKDWLAERKAIKALPTARNVKAKASKGGQHDE